MGYTTDFTGKFDIEPALTRQQVEYLKQFSYTRRMCRDAAIAALMPDPKREAIGWPIGKDAAYYVGTDTGNFGQAHDKSITAYNDPPFGQPSLWCQWVPSDDGTSISWDGGEKFYDYVEWIEYIIANFLKPWGRVLSGAVTWQGENSADRGVIYAKDNKVKAVVDKIVRKAPKGF